MLNKLVNLMNGRFDFLYNNPEGMVINGIRLRLGSEGVDDIAVFADDVETGDPIELIGFYDLASKRFAPSLIISDRVQSDDNVEWLYDLLWRVMA